MSDLLVVGGGLAGSEAALVAANAGVQVTLAEMRPARMTPAHRSGDFAELVCSNSLKSDEVTSAAGLLKAELRLLHSPLLALAEQHRVAAGGALAVDRGGFAAAVTETIEQHPRIRVVREEVKQVDWTRPMVIAAGPLAGEELVEYLRTALGARRCAFYDAIAPVVEAESIAQPPAFRASRYGKGSARPAADGTQSPDGGGDYLNLPLTAAEYARFREALLEADRVTAHAFEEVQYFEACLPVEELARRGEDTLRFGPLKPVGLRDPRTGERPYAVVQLRQDDRAGALFNLVGFQTRLQPSAQERVLRLLPGLAQVRIARYGGMHRNTYFDLTGVLAPTLELQEHRGVFIAGQLAGSEGYTEAIACGHLAGLNAARRLQGQEPVAMAPETALGALVRYITTPAPQPLAPMHATFGLLPPVDGGKRDRRERQAARALALMTDMARQLVPREG